MFVYILARYKKFGANHLVSNISYYCFHQDMLILVRAFTVTSLVTPKSFSIQNQPRQLANPEAFAEAYLHFIVFALAINMPRQLNSYKFDEKKLKKKFFFFFKKKIFLIKKTFFTKHKLFMCIFIHYSYLYFLYFQLITLVR